MGCLIALPMISHTLVSISYPPRNDHLFCYMYPLERKASQRAYLILLKGPQHNSSLENFLYVILFLSY